MKILLLAFGRTAEIVGARSVELDIQARNVAELRRELSAIYPGLAMTNYGVAVDRVHALNEDALREGAEVALIPPVSGG